MIKVIICFDVYLVHRSMSDLRIRAANRQLTGFTKDKEGEWNGPFCFIQAADTQFGMMASYVHKRSYKDITWDEEIKLTQKAVRAANRMTPKPRFFIVCGDLVDAMPGDGYKSAQEKDLKQVLRELDPDIPAVCVCGNHDIGDQPTPVTVQNYRDSFGDDYFVFWVGGVKCIVINSQYYENRSQVVELAEEQDRWLDEQLQAAQQENCRHLLIFQHIPWFLKMPNEEKEYFNVAQPLRQHMLDKFHNAGVRVIFCGHYHRNAGGFYKDMELVVTSAIGAQIGSDPHGIRVVKVTEHAVTHKYYGLDLVPETIDLTVP